MDGIHDLGEMEGFGPVDVEPDEPVFHAAWERTAFGLTMASFMSGLSNGGEFRHSIERMDAAHYLTSRYYEHWFTGTATRYVETGVVPLDELESRAGGSFPLSRPVLCGSAPRGPETRTERTWAVGDRVRVRDVDTRGHTRCPRYVRGRVGIVVRADGPSSLPDVEAHSPERRMERQYCVAFPARDDDGATVHVDLFESYLEDAP